MFITSDTQNSTKIDSLTLAKIQWHFIYPILDRGKDLSLFVLTQTVNVMIIPLRCTTSQKETKKDSFPLVLERGIKLEDQQQILDKEAINYYLLQIRK